MLSARKQDLTVGKVSQLHKIDCYITRFSYNIILPQMHCPSIAYMCQLTRPLLVQTSPVQCKHIVLATGGLIVRDNKC